MVGKTLVCESRDLSCDPGIEQSDCGQVSSPSVPQFLRLTSQGRPCAQVC